MGFYKKYYTPFGDDLGNVWEVSLWEDGAGVPEQVAAADPPCELIYEGQGQFPFSNPIRGSKCTYTILAQESGVEADLEDIIEADEGSYRIEISKNGSLFWRGSVLPELSDIADTAYPVAYAIGATDGLGRLEGIPFLDSSEEPYSGRAPKLEIVLDCLNKLEMFLGINTADDWYSEDMVQGIGDDPLIQAEIDRLIFYDENGLPANCLDVLKTILLKKSLVLFQSMGAWWIVQRQEYAKSSFNLRHWSYDHVWQSAEVFDPRVTFDNSAVRMNQPSHSKAKPLRSVSVTYEQTRPYTFRNGDFEEWDIVSNVAVNPTQWTICDGTVHRSTFARNGKYSLGFEPLQSYYGYSGGYNPSTMARAKFQGSQLDLFPNVSQIKFAGSLGWQLKEWDDFGISGEPPEDFYLGYDGSARRAYFCLRVGDYCLTEEFVINNPIDVGIPGNYEWTYSPATDLWCSMFAGNGWHDFEITTQPIPIAGAFSFIVTQIIDDGRDLNGLSFVKESNWDNLRAEILFPYNPGLDVADTLDAVETIYAVEIGGATVKEDFGTVGIGDGPTSASLSRITVGGTDTALWTRKGLNDDLNLDALNTLMTLRATWKPNRIFRTSLHADYFAHNSLVVRGVMYALNGGSFNPKTGFWAGEWREARDDAGEFVTEESKKQASGFFSAASGTVGFFFQLSNRIGQLTASRSVTTLSANLLADIAITQIPINVIGEHLFDAGDTLILVNLKNATVVQLTVSQNQLAADNHIHINSWTPDEDWYVGSVIYQSDKQLLSMIIQNENAIVLRVQYGEVASQLTIEAASITFDTNIVKSDNWNGVVDGSGHITTPGTVGWAITGYGEGEFATLNARGTFVTGVGTKRVEIRSSDNEMEFFEGGVSKVRIGSEISSGSPGIKIDGGVIYVIAENANAVVAEVTVTTTAQVSALDSFISSSYAMSPAQDTYAVRGFAQADYGNPIALYGNAVGGANSAQAVGIYGTASGAPAGKNLAGYFDAGNVYIKNQLQIVGGVPGAGKVLTSDVNGVGTWETPSGGGWTVASNIVKLTTITDQVTIGGATAVGKLSVEVTGNDSQISNRSYGGAAQFDGYQATGSPSSPGVSLINARLAMLRGAGYDGSGFQMQGSIDILTSEQWTTTALGTYIRFRTTPTGSTTIAEVARLNNVGFGVGVTPLAKLHVQSITEQLRLSVNVDNYFSTTVGATGIVTFDAVGAGASFVFSDYIILQYDPTHYVDFVVDSSAYLTIGGINTHTWTPGKFITGTLDVSGNILAGSASSDSVITESYNAIVAPGTLGVGIPTIGTNIITGILAINNTAAANNAPKMSPAIQLKHFSWNPTAGASQENSWYMVNWGFQTEGAAGGVLVFTNSQPSTSSTISSFAIDEMGRTLIGCNKYHGSNYWGFNGQDFGSWGVILASSQPVVVGWPEQSITTNFRVTGNTTLSGTANAIGTITSGTWQGGVIAKAYLATDISSLGTVVTGIWQGTAIAAAYISDLSGTYSLKAGNTSLVTVGTITTGHWHGDTIDANKIADLSGTYSVVGHSHAFGAITGLLALSQITPSGSPVDLVLKSNLGSVWWG